MPLKPELVARNKEGEVRAWIRFDEEPWTVTELLAVIQGWAETDPDRKVTIEGATLPSPPASRGEG